MESLLALTLLMNCRSQERIKAICQSKTISYHHWKRQLLIAFFRSFLKMNVIDQMDEGCDFNDGLK